MHVVANNQVVLARDGEAELQRAPATPVQALDGTIDLAVLDHIVVAAHGERDRGVPFHLEAVDQVVAPGLNGGHRGGLPVRGIELDERFVARAVGGIDATRADGQPRPTGSTDGDRPLAPLVEEDRDGLVLRDLAESRPRLVGAGTAVGVITFVGDVVFGEIGCCSRWILCRGAGGHDGGAATACAAAGSCTAASASTSGAAGSRVRSAARAGARGPAGSGIRSAAASRVRGAAGISPADRAGVGGRARRATGSRCGARGAATGATVGFACVRARKTHKSQCTGEYALHFQPSFIAAAR